MRRLLFLIADTGGGHRAAATAVERQMAETAPGEFEITILDPFERREAEGSSAGPRVSTGRSRVTPAGSGAGCTTPPTAGPR